MISTGDTGKRDIFTFKTTEMWLLPTCNPSTQEAETGGLLQVSGQLQLYNKILSKTKGNRQTQRDAETDRQTDSEQVNLSTYLSLLPE